MYLFGQYVVASQDDIKLKEMFDGRLFLRMLTKPPVMEAFELGCVLVHFGYPLSEDSWRSDDQSGPWGFDCFREIWVVYILLGNISLVEAYERDELHTLS